jgi:hypothetical protein
VGERLKMKLAFDSNRLIAPLNISIRYCGRRISVVVATDRSSFEDIPTNILSGDTFVHLVVELPLPPGTLSTVSSALLQPRHRAQDGSMIWSC